MCVLAQISPQPNVLSILKSAWTLLKGAEKQKLNRGYVFGAALVAEFRQKFFLLQRGSAPQKFE